MLKGCSLLTLKVAPIFLFTSKNEYPKKVLLQGCSSYFSGEGGSVVCFAALAVALVVFR
jgi:hypothetical protein